MSAVNPVLKPAASVDTPLLNAIHVLTALLGRPTTREHLTYGLALQDGDVPLASVSRALGRAGLASTVQHIDQIEAEHLPACAVLKDQRVVVVVKRDDNDLVIADTDIHGGERKVSSDEFSQMFSGTLVRALPSLDDLERRHIASDKGGHWFWQQLQNQKDVFANIALGTLFANVLAIGVSLFALQVYDRVIPNQSETSLWVLVVGCVIAIGLEAMLRVARSALMDVSGKQIEINLSRFLIERLSGMRLSGRPASPGSLTHLMRGFGSVREFFTNTSIGSVADIPFVLLFLGVIYAIAGNTVWIIVVGMVLIVVPNLIFQKRMFQLSEEMLGGTASASKLLTELTYGLESVKASSSESHFHAKWDEITALNAIKTSEQRALAAKLTHWAAGVQQATYVATIVAGVYAVFAGELTVGAIIAISILSSRTLAPVTQLSGAISRWQMVKSALVGLDAVVDSQQDREQGRTYSRKRVVGGDIALADVGFGYDVDQAAAIKIQNVSLSAGSVVAILGANGSGKSTLLKLLSGLYTADSGTITMGGLDINHIDPADLRRSIGYLPQESRLFTGSLRENLMLGVTQANDDDVAEALEFSGLDKVIARLPLGLDTQIEEGGEGLSVGHKQSLALARLFLHDPQIVLLDEPTASLDQTLEAELVRSLSTWLKGRTCVLATHRVPILSLAERVIVMQHGQISMDGSTNDVIKCLTARPVEAA